MDDLADKHDAWLPQKNTDVKTIYKYFGTTNDFSKNRQAELMNIIAPVFWNMANLAKIRSENHELGLRRAQGAD
jgi:hypothetical protein